MIWRILHAWRVKVQVNAESREALDMQDAVAENRFSLFVRLVRMVRRGRDGVQVAVEAGMQRACDALVVSQADNVRDLLADLDGQVVVV